MQLPKISFSQLVNLSLATFLLVGIAATTYSVTSLTTFESQARGKPGGSTASIRLDQTDPHLGDSVTFTTSGSGNRIQVACYGLGLEVIYAADQPVGTAFLLGGTSSVWLSRGGSSDCYAWLVVKDMTKILASTRFTSAGAR